VFGLIVFSLNKFSQDWRGTLKLEVKQARSVSTSRDSTQ